MANDNLVSEILIVDDNEQLRTSIVRVLTTDKNYHVHEADSAEKALDILKQHDIQLMVTDLKLPEMDGEALMKLAKQYKPEMEVVMITGHGTIDKAVHMMREGAYDFIEKPFRKDVLLRVVSKALERHSLYRKHRQLVRTIQEMRNAQDLIGSDPAFKQTMELAAQVASSEANILILGESGTGKELFANYIQKCSLRSEKPFVKINCAAIPENLLESELFGYEKGAFTGAVARKRGLVEEAEKGTLFLDEIGDMSLALQAKLLRFLEQGEFQRVGGIEVLHTDIRFIAATNAVLEDRVKEKTFREDLYYRLNVIKIQLPSLRQRKEDIPLLAAHFLKIFSEKNKKDICSISREALNLLISYDWPGNVRQLENVMERAVVITRGNTIEIDVLGPEIVGSTNMAGYITFKIGTSLEEVEARMIEETLRLTNADKEAAAKLLKTSSRTIYRKVSSVNKSST